MNCCSKLGDFAMKNKTILRINRRALLSGIAAIAASFVIGSKTKAASSRIVMRDGWLLKESDFQ